MIRLRYDADRGSLAIGIRDLIEVGTLPASLVSDEPWIDVQHRNRVHSRFQARYCEQQDAEGEVPVFMEVERGGYRFLISGRLDILDDSHDPPLVIEVKTRGSTLPPEPDPLHDFPGHVLQLAFYCRALAEERGYVPSGRLVFLVLDERKPSELELDIDVWCDEVQDLWERKLDLVASILDRERNWRERQLEALESFQFPYPDPRPGQEEMRKLIERTIEQRGALFLEAPTGIGKTAAALAGTLPHVIRDDLTAFFLTAKGTQVRNTCTTVDRIVESGLPLRSIVITAREKICPLPSEMCCEIEECPYAREYGSRIEATDLVRRLLEIGRIYPDVILQHAMEAGVCPFELSLDMSVYCELIICDYNYVFDPHVYLRRFFAEGLAEASSCVLLIDEAPNLPGRARGYYSPEMRESILSDLGSLEQKLRRKVRRRAAPWHALFEEIGDALDRAGEDEIELPDDTAIPINADSWRRLVMDQKGSPPKKLLELFGLVLDFSRIEMLRGDSRFHLLGRRESGDTVVQWFCTDPSEMLRERHSSCAASALFSATLTPFEHYEDLLGYDPVETATARIAYPFPQENLGVWIDPRIDTRYRYRRSSLPLLTERIGKLYATAPGTYLVFCPSYAYMRMIGDSLRSTSIPVLSQRRGMSNREREEFLAEVESKEQLVLTVSGGIFAEGIDINAPELRGALVIGPCLPGIDLRNRLLSQRFDEREKNGFLHVSIIPGMNRVIQAAGRMIRSPDDRGTLILFGRRFAMTPYRELLPEHWKDFDSVGILSVEMSEISGFWR